MCVITAREQLQNYTLHKFLVGMYPELLSTYKAVYSTKTLYRMKEYFSIHYYSFVGFSSLESLIIVFIWALRIKQWVHTGVRKVIYQKFFHISLLFHLTLLTIFFKIIGDYTEFYLSERPFILLCKTITFDRIYKNFVFFVRYK